jgi:ribosomal protein S26
MRDFGRLRVRTRPDVHRQAPTFHSHEWCDMLTCERAMTKYKALSLMQARTYVLEKWGDEGIARVQAALSPEACAAIYSEQLIPTDWIELDYCIEHVVVIDRVLGKGDGKTSSELVRTLTQNHFSSLYRSMFAGVSPRAMLEKTGRLWNRFYDRGETQIEVVSDTWVIKRILNCPDLPLHHEWFLIPYYEELLRLAGATPLSVRQLKCVALNAKYCEIELRWTQP